MPEKKKSYKEMREEQRLREEAERRPSLILPDEVKQFGLFLINFFDKKKLPGGEIILMLLVQNMWHCDFYPHETFTEVENLLHLTNLT